MYKTKPINIINKINNINKNHIYRYLLQLKQNYILSKEGNYEETYKDFMNKRTTLMLLLIFNTNINNINTILNLKINDFQNLLEDNFIELNEINGNIRIEFNNYIQIDEFDFLYSDHLNNNPDYYLFTSCNYTKNKLTKKIALKELELLISKINDIFENKYNNYEYGFLI